MRTRSVCTALLIVLVCSHVSAQFVQQGNRLLGTGAVGGAGQGKSVSLSADGNTAIVGGPEDNGYVGGAWIFTCDGGVWSQQGEKLIGTGAVGNAWQGTSVSLSADGNTAIIGGPYDNGGAGAVWVFTRSGSVWSQQGEKLVGRDALGDAQQGTSVSLSADGNTAIVGGPGDNGSIHIGPMGAVWVFTRSAGVWSQQGEKLVGTGAGEGSSVSLSADGNTAIVGGPSPIGGALVFTRSGGVWSQQGEKLVGTGIAGEPFQGTSVSLSADGNTAIVGGPKDGGDGYSSIGAAWIFIRSGGAWSQQGGKLVGTGDEEGAEQGNSVSISADGNTAIVGGPDGSAVWVYTRNGDVWSQQGDKLVGTGAVGRAQQGASVSISADGNTAIVGGPSDNGGAGAVWVFKRSGSVWSQYGSKLVGTGAFGEAKQGAAVSLSADGNTAIIGGPDDNGSVGAVWVFTRNGEVWSQQGEKLAGTGAVGSARQGSAVSLSADGNTAIVGGFDDNGKVGAVWVFARNGGVWGQQGDKLVGTGAVGRAQQGASVSISADGNTAIVGGPSDNDGAGAVWVFKRSGSLWSQQGDKLLGTGAVGNAAQGCAVSLSADGNTAIVGAHHDSSCAGCGGSTAGAAWIFTRSGGVWSQQGGKLVGTGSAGQAHQGSSVSLSADGNTAIVGGNWDRDGGAAWIFTRSGGVWSQQGGKLVGTGGVGSQTQGTSVSLSADGNTAIVGGPQDNGYIGAAWIFTRSGGLWTQRGNKLVGTGSGYYTFQGQSVSLSADGKTAIVGGPQDHEGSGAAWVYVKSTTGPAGPIAYYPFNGNANDLSGNSRHGTVVRATPTADRFGNANSAYDFDGDSSYIRASGVGLPSAVRTISVWFNAKSVEEQPTLLFYGSGYRTLWLQGINHRSSESFAVVSGEGAKEVMAPYTTSPVGKWVHWVVVTSPDGTKFFVDGTEYYSSLLYYDDTNTTAGDLGFGVAGSDDGVVPFTNGNSGWFRGALDDIRMYDRALNETEIAELYHEGGWDPAPGLVAYYPFNGNANDESGNENNGTVYGASSTTDRFGVPGRAYHFAGFGDVIEIPVSTSLQLPSQRTVVAWIHLDSQIKASNEIIASGVYNTSTDWALTVDASGSNGALHSRPQMWIDGQWRYYDGATEVYKQRWQMLAMTFDGSSLKSYVDGLNDGSMSYPGTARAASSLIRIGPWKKLGAFPGDIDDIRIYNRVLTEGEIADLYHEGGWPHPSGSIVINGGFENGRSPWEHYHNGGASNSFNVVTTPPISEGTYKGKVVIDETIGTNNQIWQDWIPLQANMAYRLSFKHHASDSTSFRVRLIEQDDDLTVYGFPFRTVSTTTGVQDYTLDFTAANFTGTVNDAMLQFYFVNGTPSRIIYLDNIAITEQDGPPPVLPPWTYTHTGISHRIIIPLAASPDVDGTPLTAGDYVGVFYDSSGTMACAGYEAWTDSANITVVAFGDDAISPAKDGFANGELFKWKVWRHGGGAVADGTTTYLPVGSLGGIVTDTSMYNTNGASALASLNGILVSVSRIELPEEFSLQQNYPNPFNPSTTIAYGLPTRSQVTLAVYNALGQQVSTLVKEEQEAGHHEVQLDASSLASGIYLYRLQAGNFVQTRKLILLK